MSGEGLDFSGFDREDWKPRNSSEHKRAAKRTLEETSPAAQQRLYSELGARYSVLQELEYFDCIRYFVVDPMNNLYLGTAEHMMKNVWLNENNEFLCDEDFQRNQRAGRFYDSSLRYWSYTRKDFIKFHRIHSRSMEKLDISVFIVCSQRNLT